MIKKIILYLNNRSKLSKLFINLLGISFIIIVGIIDYITGEEFVFSIFYLFPVMFVTWFTNKWYGIFNSTISAVAIFLADFEMLYKYSYPLIHFWNIIIRLGIFLILVYILSMLKNSFKRLQELARIDGLTGMLNRRFFYELADVELKRAHRYSHPTTVVYLDLDNFKQINDNLGHSAGDKVLIEISKAIKQNLRQTDIIARLGGDEFVLLLPEAGYDSAYDVIKKVKSTVLSVSETNGWNVTCSIGAVTCSDIQCSIEDIIKKADALMYEAKSSGKNMIVQDMLNLN